MKFKIKLFCWIR